MMKKHVFIALILTLFLLPFKNVNAQLDLGIKAGANFANISDLRDNGTRTGFVAGVFGGGKLGKKWALQGELLYSQQGSKLDVFEFDVDYVNVPIIFKRYLGLGFNIQFGPQFGFVVDDNIDKLPNNIQADIEAKEFDLSGAVGLGFDFIFGIRVDARYQFGLLKVTDTSAYQGQNQVFSLCLGYSFL